MEVEFMTLLERDREKFEEGVEKGIEKRIKSLCPQMNILSLDFDSSVSDVNITNRLLLFIDNINN